MSNFTRCPSPDGRYYILLAASEIRMSHWIETAALWREGDSHAFLRIGSSQWSADSVQWADDSRSVTLEMRRYPGDAPAINVTLYPDAGEAGIEGEAAGARITFGALSEAMERRYRDSRPQSTRKWLP